MSKLSVMKGCKFTAKRLRQWLEEDGVVVLQTKRDEFRCVVEVDLAMSTVTYTSASGKPLYNLNGFDADMLEAAYTFGISKFDCGCMVNDSFELTRRTLRASKKVYDLTGDTLCIVTEKEKRKNLPDGSVEMTPGFYFAGGLHARFWLYDLPTRPFSYVERRAEMANIAREFPSCFSCPETEVILARDGDIDAAVAKVYEVNAAMVQAGHEGTMVKRFDYVYSEGYGVSWMKMKPCEEVDVQVVDFVPGKDSFEGMVGSLVGRTLEGEFVTFSGFDMTMRQELTDDFDKFKGQWAEVRYMQRDSKGGFRHPQFFRWHPDK